MDPEHRHELKESDLERFIRNFGPWWRKHGTTVLLVIALTLLTFVVMRYLTTRTDRARENAYTALAEARSPAAMQDVARQHEGVQGLAGRALLQAGDMKLQEALVGPSGAQGQAQAGLSGGGQSLSAEERTESLEQAAELYQRAVDRADSPLVVINARMGLAAAHESLGRFEQARQEYERVREQAGGSYPALAERARDRLADLDQISEPIEFPDPPETAEGEGGSPHGGSSLGGQLPFDLDLSNMADQPAEGESPSGAGEQQSGESALPDLLETPEDSEEGSGGQRDQLPSGTPQQDGSGEPDASTDQQQ